MFKLSELIHHIDWLGVVLNLTGWFLMAKRRFLALLILVVANITWLTWSIETHTLSYGFLQASFMILNIRTIASWFKSEKQKPVEFRDSSFIRINAWLTSRQENKLTRNEN